MTITTAILDAEGNVVNRIDWDGSSSISLPAGQSTKADPGNVSQIGGRVFHGVFVDIGAPDPTTADLCAAVQSFCSQRLAAGYADATTGKTWLTDPTSIANFTAVGSAAALAVAANNTSTSFSLIAADGSINQMTAANAYALLSGRVMPWVSATIVYSQTMVNGILAGTVPADITQGWP